jgi:hypothetical protein
MSIHASLNHHSKFFPDKSPPAQALEGQEFLKIVTKLMICAEVGSAQGGLTHQEGSETENPCLSQI